jgi:hypothetical protein
MASIAAAPIGDNVIAHTDERRGLLVDDWLFDNVE